MTPNIDFLQDADEIYQLERPMRVDSQLGQMLDELVATGRIDSYEFNDSKTELRMVTDNILTMTELRDRFGEIDIIK